MKKKDRYDNKKAKVFTIIMEPCEESMKHRVECSKDYVQVESDSDVKAVLTTIKDLAYGSNDKKFPARQATLAWKQIIHIKQEVGEELTVCFKWFNSAVEGIERSYGEIKPTKVAERDSKYASSKDKAKLVEKA